MMKVEIPGRGNYELKHLVMDVNGTIAVDGNLKLGVIPRLFNLRDTLQLHLLTADTHGHQAQINSALGLQARIITKGAIEKGDFVRELGAESVVALGNGANDVEMFKAASISIAVMGGEGLSPALLAHADVLVDDV
ncbi:MAG TPA: HAD hydrolase family protein, partial [Aggregatilineales bacterium]|nr:HAD hydrolase family protein [Aggregatilineales bacterium]